MEKLSVAAKALQGELIPPVREKMRKEMPEHYRKMATTHKLRRQTFEDHEEKLGGVTLNYVNINNNKRFDYPNQYDYKVKDAISLAKLFMEPNKAKFSDFDDNFEPLAVLNVLAGVEEFDENVREAAKDLKRVLRNPWAHSEYRKLTDDKYIECFRVMESLVKSFFQSEDQKRILDKLEERKAEGKSYDVIGGFFLTGGVLILSDISTYKNNNNNSNNYDNDSDLY